MAHEKVAQWQGQQQQLDHPSTFNPQPYTPQGQINYQPTMHAPMNASAPPLKEHLQQPAPQASATSADVLNMSNKPKDHNGERDWSHGLCGCFDDCSTCCVACWCPCVTYADTRERLKALRNGQAKPEGGSFCSGACWGFCCLNYLTGCGWLLTMFQRTDVRDRYHIKGGGCADCCTSFWCHPCAQVQHSREMELEEVALLSSSSKGAAPHA